MSTTVILMRMAVISMVVLAGCRPIVPVSNPASAISSRQAPVSRWIELQPGLRVCPVEHEVELEAVVCLESGWLEQVMCGPGTREHESILVTSIAPSAFHGALLAAGLRPGSPGSWREVGEDIVEVLPTGERVEIMLAVDGTENWVSVKSWIEGDSDRTIDGDWIFGGSFMRSSDEVPAGYSLYEADLSGSVIGLVTFGDETIGLSRIIPDQVALEPAQWKVRDGAVPPVGTVIRVRVRSVDR